MTTTRRSTLAAIGGLGALSVTGTALAIGEHEDDERENDDDEMDDTDDTNGEETAATAAVRVAHFSPDAPAVDVYVDDDQVLADVAYDTVSPYLEIAPGTYQVRITAAGDPDTVVFDDEVPVSRAFYTIAAIGELEADTFRPLILTDAGSALIRLAHVSPDAPAVDIVGSDGAPTLFENVSFGEATNYVALPAGTYSLDVRPAAGDGDGEAGGTAPDTDDENGDDMDDTDGAEAVATVEVTLEPGTAYTAFATGYLEAEPPFAVRLETDGPEAAEAPTDDEPVDDDTEEPADDDEMDDDTDDEMEETDDDVDDDYEDDERGDDYDDGEMDDDYEDDEEMDDDHDDEEMDDDYEDDDYEDDDYEDDDVDDTDGFDDADDTDDDC